MILFGKVDKKEFSKIDVISNVIHLSKPWKTGKLPTRPKNRDVRSREYVTNKEVDQLMTAAKKTGRHGHRDATMILLAYRHGLRVSG
jgi:site-specific recombinase XerD